MKKICITYVFFILTSTRTEYKARAIRYAHLHTVIEFAPTAVNFYNGLSRTAKRKTSFVESFLLWYSTKSKLILLLL